MIMTSMITSNLLPYAGPLLKILFRRGICCCRRKDYKPNTHLNEEFPFVRRYATILSTVFICFTYGFGIPLLFIVTFFIILVQYILDKLLITYYFKERVEQNDLLNRTALNILKYGIVVFMFFGGWIITSNHCTVE